MGEGSMEFVSKTLFSLGEVLLGVNNFLVASKVWNKVSSWRWLSVGERGTELMVPFSLRLSSVELGDLSIFVRTEVWDEVSSWGWLSMGEGSGELMAPGTFSLSGVGQGCDDIGILTEVWNWVVNLPVWSNPGGVSGLETPWLLWLSASILKGYGLDFLREN